MLALPPDPAPIVITASRAPIAEEETAVSVSIFDDTLIERLDEPLIGSILRLAPSIAVSSSGPAGSLTDVRIRGAEANHSLLFIDGIRINDPASGDIPRFEMVNADIASRIEIVRGPQSALWGSDAIGGVIAVNGVTQSPGIKAALEGGSFGLVRASVAGASIATGSEIGGALAFQRASGIDSFGMPGGDNDGYRNLTGRVRAILRPTDRIEVGLVGLALFGSSQFDGYDPVTFEHTDTRDSSRNRLAAARAWAAAGTAATPWRGQLSLSLLGSRNRNLLDGESINRTWGDRKTATVQVERRFSLGRLDNRLIVAGEAEIERFHARDRAYGGFSDQDRSRSRLSLIGEWRVKAGAAAFDLALRRDRFNRFRDATTLRASARFKLARDFALHGSYGEGIAPPTFFDLYGFFPGNFVGNPSLKPERSTGFEVGLDYSVQSISLGVTAYRQRLADEIVDVYDPETFLQSSSNRSGRSRRWGIELEASYRLAEALHLVAVYSFLDASQPASGGRQVVELRRPRHSGSLLAVGAWKKWRYGASLAYVGRHRDIRDSYPYDTVVLGSYWLANVRIAYALTDGAELFVRGSNLLDSRYQDTAGYHAEGRGLFAGIRLADRQSSP